MAEDQGIKSLKIFKKNKQPLSPNDWTAGVDYETINDENILDEEGNYHEVQLFNEEEYEQMDQNEINDLIADEGEQSDPTIENNNEFQAHAEEMEAEVEEEHPDDESQEESDEVAEPTRTRPTRTVKHQLTDLHTLTTRHRGLGETRV